MTRVHCHLNHLSDLRVEGWQSLSFVIVDAKQFLISERLFYKINQLNFSLPFQFLFYLHALLAFVFEYLLNLITTRRCLYPRDTRTASFRSTDSAETNLFKLIESLMNSIEKTVTSLDGRRTA